MWLNLDIGNDEDFLTLKVIDRDKFLIEDINKTLNEISSKLPDCSVTSIQSSYDIFNDFFIDLNMDELKIIFSYLKRMSSHELDTLIAVLEHYSCEEINVDDICTAILYGDTYYLSTDITDYYDLNFMRI